MEFSELFLLVCLTYINGSTRWLNLYVHSIERAQRQTTQKNQTPIKAMSINFRQRESNMKNTQKTLLNCNE